MMVTQLPLQVTYAVTHFSSMCVLFISHLDVFSLLFLTINSHALQKAGIILLEL